MDRFTLSLATGAIAGAVAVLPMIARKASVRNCCAVFLAYLFAGVTVFYSDLPYLPWWADGMGVALMLTIPSATIGSGKETGSFRCCSTPCCWASLSASRSVTWDRRSAEGFLRRTKEPQRRNGTAASPPRVKKTDFGPFFCFRACSIGTSAPFFRQNTTRKPIP